LWDLSLVDPDNRRPVDFPARESKLAALASSVDFQGLADTWPDGRIKFALTQRLLAIRQQFANIFTNGSYRPLAVGGPDHDNVIAFARTDDRQAIIVALGRLFARSTDGGRQWPSMDRWRATIAIDGFSSLSNLLGGAEPSPGSEMPAAALFGPLPVAIFRADRISVPRQPRSPRHSDTDKKASIS
jgi:(1->4)-alpha-D-glucan 1-alpha-D-glucosylmutase